MNDRYRWLRFEATRFIPDIIGGLVVFAIFGSLFTVFWLGYVPTSDKPVLLSGLVEKTHPVFNEGPTLQRATVILSDGRTVVVPVSDAAKPVNPGDAVQITEHKNMLGGHDLRITKKLP